MTFPATRTVQRLARVDGAQDAYGDTADAWAEPVDVLVHAWAPPSADGSPVEEARNAVTRDLDLYAPAGTTGAPRDRWIVGGVTFEQVGWPEDYTNGPWSWSAGVRINLKRTEG